MKETIIVALGFTLFVIVAKHVTMFHVKQPESVVVEQEQDAFDRALENWEPFR